MRRSKLAITSRTKRGTAAATRVARCLWCAREGFRCWRGPALAGLLAAVFALACPSILAQTAPGEPKPPEVTLEKPAPPGSSATPVAKPGATAKTGGANDLTLRQQQLADQFRHFEEVLLRMAELTAPSDPRRAALLRKAVAQSKERLVGLQFDQLVKLLEKDQLSRAIENQTTLDKDLQALLDLLLSENRDKRLESEKARIAHYIKNLNQLIKQQKSIQGRTAGSENPKPLAEEQRKLADRTGDLARDMKAHEDAAKPAAPGAQEAPPKDGSPGKPPSQDQAPSGDKKKSGDSKESKDRPRADKTPPPGKDRPPSEEQQGGPPKEGDSAKKGPPPTPGGQPAPEGQDAGQPADSAPSQQENPTRKRLENARQRMQAAEKHLQEAKQKQAVEQQEEAIRELEQAKRQLEEILRQLREEEMERMLTMLDARFRKMLGLQRDVLEGTVRLDKVPEAERAHNHEIEAGRLSTKETDIIAEADKAMLVLREDGSTQAFPEAVSQMRQDMQQVAQRLAEAKTGKITQSIEEDIIAALEEMLASLKKAQKDLEDKKQKMAAGESGEASAPPLVDALSELRMIRALQMRVNSRTERYSKLIDGEQAGSAELIEALQRLADQERRIRQITRDLELGKNR